MDSMGGNGALPSPEGSPVLRNTQQMRTAARSRIGCCSVAGPFGPLSGVTARVRSLRRENCPAVPWRQSDLYRSHSAFQGWREGCAWVSIWLVVECRLCLLTLQWRRSATTHKLGWRKRSLKVRLPSPAPPVRDSCHHLLGHSQAYKEIKEDGHPIIIISGGDIVRLLEGEGRELAAEHAFMAELFPGRSGCQCGLKNLALRLFFLLHRALCTWDFGIVRSG